MDLVLLDDNILLISRFNRVFLFDKINKHMSLNIPLLKEICETPGAPGREERVRKLVLREIEQLTDSFEIDNIGNVIGVRKGRTDKRVIRQPITAAAETIHLEARCSSTLTYCYSFSFEPLAKLGFLFKIKA